MWVLFHTMQLYLKKNTQQELNKQCEYKLTPMDEHDTYGRCVFVGMWEFLSGYFSAYFLLPPHKCFTVTIPQERYKVCFCVAEVHLGRPQHLQPGKNTAQLWTIPHTHTYSYASKLFSMCSPSLTLSLARTHFLPPYSLSAQSWPFLFFVVHLQPVHPLHCSFPPSFVFVLRLMTLSVCYKAV